ENETLLTMHEVLEDVLPPEMHPYLVCLSGPSFAKETMLKMPTAVVVASPWEKMAQRVQRWFSNDYFRVYTPVDVVGVELGRSRKASGPRRASTTWRTSWTWTCLCTRRSIASCTRICRRRLPCSRSRPAS